jgi:hypothetical protein
LSSVNVAQILICRIAGFNLLTLGAPLNATASRIARGCRLQIGDTAQIENLRYILGCSQP